MPYPDNNFSGQIEGEVIVYGKDTCIFTTEVAGRWCSHRCLSFCSEVPMWPLPMMHWTSLYRALPSPHIRPKTPLEQHRGSSLETCSNLFIWWPSPATSGGCHWSTTCGFQARGTHPTGMLSCFWSCWQYKLFVMCDVTENAAFLLLSSLLWLIQTELMWEWDRDRDWFNAKV